MSDSHFERYTAIRGLLADWSVLWGHSVFHRFHEKERLVPESWFAFGASAELKAQFDVGQGVRVSGAPESLLDWIAEARRLCALPRAPEPRVLGSPFDRDLTPKKKHEIQAVLGLLGSKASSASEILDIGGGAGHLARSLSHALECPVASVDRNGVLQEKGRRIQSRWPWKTALKFPVRFVQGEFPEVGATTESAVGSWSVGLHTCGGLAWSQLELARSGRAVLNVGCCYDKLNLATDVQRSRAARELSLSWTQESLFLANRGGVERTLEEFLFQQRVQRFRFSLHELLLREGLDAAKAEAVGSARDEVYRGTFAEYVRDRVALGISDAAVEEFYRSIAPLIERKRFVAFLRNLMARSLEMAILLDRALFIEEGFGRDGLKVRLVELFDPKVSPRNVGLVVGFESPRN